MAIPVPRPAICGCPRRSSPSQDLSRVRLKNVSRIEALLFLYFVALLVHAFIEREVHRGMVREKVESLPFYPQERACQVSSSERILDPFALLQRHRLRQGNRLVLVFEPELGALHERNLALMRLPPSTIRPKTQAEPVTRYRIHEVRKGGRSVTSLLELAMPVWYGRLSALLR